jgi:purine-binding chemotaxis protein CheW
MSGAAVLEERGRSGAVANHLDYENQYVSFVVNGQLLGIPVNTVQEVLNPQSITPVPKAPREIAGLLNLRGQIVTAVNLRRRLGLADLPSDRESMNVVVRHHNESFSLLVDEVGDVINVDAESLQPAPQTLDPLWKSVTKGVFRLERQLFVILDVGTILTLK